MDGIVFYWLMWVVWAYITFFMRKTTLRFQISFFLLLIIMTSNIHFHLLGLEVDLAMGIILLYGYYLIGQIDFKYFFYSIFGCGVISIVYTCFFMIGIYDPIWLIIDMKWMLSITMIILSLLIFRKSEMRLPALAVGLCHGEILYTLVIIKLNPSKIIGDLYFLDIFASGIFICLCLYLFEQMAKKLQQITERSIQGKKQVFRHNIPK